MGDSDDSSTEERIDRLESVVKQQNETIREMLPGRRAVVAGGAAAALGFGAGAGSASGQSAAGQVGTESEPVDVEAADVAAQTVDTAELQYAVGNTGGTGRLSDRPMVSTQSRTIDVGGDVDTIQEALNELPLLLRHRYQINVPSGTYDEDLLVPPLLAADTVGTQGPSGGPEGPTHNPYIEGDPNTPTNVEVNSITLTGVQGAITPIFTGFNPTGSTPYDDESVACAVFGCQNAEFRRMDFSGCVADSGFIYYSSTGTLRDGIHLGDDDLVHAVQTKHQATVTLDDFPAENNPMTGTTTGQLVRPTDGSVVFMRAVDATGSDRVLWPGDGVDALVVDYDNSELYVGPFYGTGSGKQHIFSELLFDEPFTQILEFGSGGELEAEFQTDKLRIDDGSNIAVDLYEGGGFGSFNKYDLSNKEPNNDGHILRDDGTNFVEGEYAFADAPAGVWRAFSDPANNTVSY